MGGPTTLFTNDSNFTSRSFLSIKMASFTCLSCRVVFKDADSQRAHYKADWHRYNLKRKVAELPPVTLDVFNQKVGIQEKKKVAKETDTTLVCKACNKTFSSENSHENHL